MCNLRSDDTIEDTWKKIVTFTTRKEGTFELFEVDQRWGEKYCRVNRIFSDLFEIKRKKNKWDKKNKDDNENNDGPLTVNDINDSVPFALTNRSTWLFLEHIGPGEENHELCNLLKSFRGPNSRKTLNAFEGKFERK